MFGIEVDDPRNLKLYLKGIRLTIEDVKKKLPEAFAKRCFYKLKDNVYKNRFKLAPNNPKYLRWKRNHGMSRHVLVATTEYVKSIKLKRVGKIWFVAVSSGVMHSNSDLTMEALAKILELGSISRGIPARPLWALTQAQQEKEYPKFAKEFARKVVSELMQVNVGGGRGGRRWLEVKFT